MGRKRRAALVSARTDAPADDAPDASGPPGGDTGSDAGLAVTGPGSDNDDNLPLPPPSPPPGLAAIDELVARLLELLTNGNGGAGFSRADRRTILHLLRLAQRCPAEDKVPRTCGDVDQLLAELLRKSPEEGWELKKVSVPGFGGLPQLNVYVRPLNAVLRHLVATLPIRWGFWGYDTVGDDEDKQRVYDHPCSGRLYEVLEAIVRGVGADALPCQLWSDKVAPFKSGAQAYYPLSVVVLSVSYDDIRKQWPRSHVAMLPVLENNAPAYSHMTGDAFRFYKAAAHAAVTSVVLYPAFDQTFRLECTDNEGVPRLVAPVFMYYVADHQEAEAANASLSHQFSLQVDLDISKNAPPPVLRSADRLEAALEAMRVDDDAGGRAAPSERQKKESKLQGVESTMLTLLRRSWLKLLPPAVLKESPWLAVPAFYTPGDKLHVHDEGLTKYFFQVRCAAGTRAHVPPEVIVHSRPQRVLYHHAFRLHGPGRARQLMRTAEARLAYIRLHAFIEKLPLPSESKLFLTSREAGKHSLPCSGLMGNELRAAMQIVVHMLHGLLEPTPARKNDYLEEVGVTMLTAYAKLMRYNCKHGHTDETLEELGTLLLRCHALVLKKETFLQDGPGKTHKWWMPKAWLGWAGAAEPHCIIQNWIKWFGHPATTSTDWGENSAKTSNAAARATNKNKDTMVAQMVTALGEKAVAARNLAEMGLSAAPPTLGTAPTAMQRAKRLGEPCFPQKATATIPLSSLDCNPVPSEYTSVLRYRDGLPELRGELSRLLGAPVDPASVVKVVNFAVIVGRPLHREGAIAYQVIYATPEFRGQRRFSWVAVNGGNGQEWYGQVQLLFKHDGHNYAYLKYVIPETDAQLLGGALLDTPGCGLFQWEGAFGVVEVGGDTDTIIRREVFIPDVSELYAPGVTVPAAKRRAAPQPDKGKQKAGAKKQKRAAKEPAAAAKTIADVAKKKKKKKKDDSEDEDYIPAEDEPDDYGTEAPQTQPVMAADPAPGFMATRWIRTQLVWGFDGGRPGHGVDEEVAEE